MNAEADTVSRSLRAARLIGIALTFGLAMISGAVVYIKQTEAVPQRMIEAPFPLGIIPLVLIPIGFLASRLLKGVMLKQFAKGMQREHKQLVEGVRSEQSRSDRAAAMAVGATIFDLVAPEGIGMLSAILYFLEGHMLSLVAIGICLLWMILLYPTPFRLAAFVAQAEQVCEAMDESEQDEGYSSR